jgi:hypothetical protein
MWNFVTGLMFSFLLSYFSPFAILSKVPTSAFLTFTFHTFPRPNAVFLTFIFTSTVAFLTPITFAFPV